MQKRKKWNRSQPGVLRWNTAKYLWSLMVLEVLDAERHHLGSESYGPAIGGRRVKGTTRGSARPGQARQGEGPESQGPEWEAEATLRLPAGGRGRRAFLSAWCDSD